MTFGEAGPSSSRSGQQPARREPPRGRRDEEDGRSRLSDPSSSRPSPGPGGINNWSRPSSRPYRPTPPGGARSNTPSPTRRHDRDRPGSGGGPAPDRRGPPTWEHRRWDRDRRDDRFRADYSPPRARRPSPPPSSLGSRRYSPPRAPRGPSNNPPALANRITSAGSGPPSRTGGPPSAPRSMRGSSSPVELRHSLAQLPGPSSVPSRTVDLPEDVKPAVPDPGEDLEEGEVVSPVRRPLPPVQLTGLPRGPGDRWTPGDRDSGPRRSLSPRKPSFRSRPVSPDYRERDRPAGRDWHRERDRDFRPTREWRRRSLSPDPVRPKIERHDSAGARLSDRSADTKPPLPVSGPRSGTLSHAPARQVSPARPSTPPIPSPANRPVALPQPQVISGAAVPARPDTPLLPEPTPATHSAAAISTPEVPAPSDADPSATDTTTGAVVDRPRTPELPAPTATTHVEQSSDALNKRKAEHAGNSGETARAVQKEEANEVNVPVIAQRSADPELPAPPTSRSPVGTHSEHPAHPTPHMGPTDIAAPASPKRAPTSPVEAPVLPTAVHASPSTSVKPLEQLPHRSAADTDDSSAANTDKPSADNTNMAVPSISQGTAGGNVPVPDPAETDNVPVQMRKAEPARLVSPTLSRITIAERRSVKLPDTAVPLSSPFGERIRKDSMPTAGSGHTSTDAETEDGPRTAEIRDEPPSADLSDGALEALEEAEMAAAIEASLNDGDREFDHEALYQWNLNVAPPPDTDQPLPETKYDRQDRVDRITWPLERDHDQVVQLVSITLESRVAQGSDRVQKLKDEYRQIHQEWQQQCEFLAAQMEKRGPPPADLFAAPHDAILNPQPPPATPGVMPTTPAGEDFMSRANRRRGGLTDVATSEEEIQRVIAQSAREMELDPLQLAYKTLAKIPAMLPESERRVRFDDDNDLVTDPLTFYDFAGIDGPVWTAEERETFRRIYPNCAKQFGKIADKLPNKTTADCVQYYYRTKKDMDWKSLARKGDRRRNRAPVVKKPGKSSALLADLKRAKPTIDPSQAPAAGAGGKSTITPGRPGKGRPPSTAGAATPSDAGPKQRRKPTVDNTTIDGLSSEATSRAGSEAPGTVAAKAKMRMSIKGKRPRVSSMTGLTSTDPLTTSLPSASGPSTAAAAAGTAMPEIVSAGAVSNPQAELLPPAKRAGKRRKVVGADGATDTPGNGPTGEKTDKPRRSATNSYWSVDEKKLVLRLFTEYGDDTERIASHIAGKSVRQVQNFLASRSGDPALGGGGGGDLGPTGPTTAYPAGYDLYSGVDRKPQQPRLGTFPTSTQPGHAHGLGQGSPPKAFSRPGGMRISALLNDDAVSEATRLDAIDAASDGTVEDDGMARPPSRSLANPAQRRPSTSLTDGHPTRPPDLDKYKSRPYESAFMPSTATSSQQQQQQHYPPGYPVQHPHPPPPTARSWEQYPHHHPHHPHHRQQPYPGQHQRPPQMGVFGPPPASGYQGRTVYDGNRERERGLPPPRDRGRSDGPAFSGFPPINPSPNAPVGHDQPPARRDGPQPPHPGQAQ